MKSEREFPYETEFLIDLTNELWYQRILWCRTNIGDEGLNWRYDFSEAGTGDRWKFKTQEGLVEFLLTWT